MNRLPLLEVDQLNPRQRRLYEAITKGRRASDSEAFRLTESDGTLTGPFGVMLQAPGIGEAFAALGEAVRYDSSLDPRAREIAILVVATRWSSDYEWYAHEVVGRDVGLTQDELEDIRTGKTHLFPTVEEQAAYELARAVAEDTEITDGTWSQAVDSLGLVSVAELVMLLGYYTALALILRAFEIGVPSGVDAPFNAKEQ